MSDENKVIKIKEEMQHDIPELLKHVNSVTSEGNVNCMVVFWKEEGVEGVNFSCGSKNRDYNLASMNWDIDQLKLGLINESYLSTGK